jgi:hypothetical protein
MKRGARHDTVNLVAHLVRRRGRARRSVTERMDRRWNGGTLLLTGGL